jgi:DNA-binding MarR family transcriptional regulator
VEHQPGHQDGSAEHPDGPAEHPARTGVRVSHLARHLGIAPRSATEVADALESAGLLTRSPDPTDRRAVLLALTERGRHTVTQVRNRRRAAADAAVARLSTADRAELRRLLEALLDA